MLPARRSPNQSYSSTSAKIISIHKANASGLFERVFFNTHNGLISIRIQEIQRCQAQGNYTEVILRNGQRHILSKNLKFVLNQIASDRIIRVHRSHAVRTDLIASIQSCAVVLLDGTTIPLSRRRKTKAITEFTAQH